jgi:hypothetical protein
LRLVTLLSQSLFIGVVAAKSVTRDVQRKQ